MPEIPSQPLIRRIRTTDLRGLLGNQLDVPPGQQAIIISPDGSVQTLPAGRQTVPGVKLFGPRPPMALVPAGEFSLPGGAPRLPTGNAQHVDASFTTTLRVGNPDLFIGRLLSEQETLTDQDLIQHLTALALPILSGLTKAYASADLCGPTPVAEQLMAELRGRLNAPLAEIGLQLIGVRYLTFSSAQTVDEQLQAIQAQSSSNVRTPELTHAAPQERSQLAQVLDQKLANVAAQIIGRLEARLQKRAPTTEHKTPASERWERFARTFQLLSALFLLMTVVLRLVLPVFIEENMIRRVSEVFGALATVATAFAWYYARTQARRQRLIEVKPVPLLDRVSDRNRQAADRLVREQLTSELTQIARTLKAAREKIYAQGREQTALTLGQTLKEVEKLNRDVATPTAGAPAYLTKPRVSLSELAAMLDYDEDLLAEAATLDDAAQALLQNVLAHADITAQATGVQGNLAQLQYRFASRARFLQTPTNAGAHPSANV
ncbi:MAG: hypothetical protein KA765_12225 [Thermoflexales bacterium]|nr:hypothetical protein [Thermoflexales bacterium]